MNSLNKTAARAEASQAPSARTRKYVIFCRHIFTARDWERFGCDYFADRGYEVSVVQCGNALEGRDFTKLSQGSYQPLANTYTPATRQDLSEFLDTLSAADLLLPLHALSAESSWLYLELANRRLTFVRISLAALPMGKNCRIVFKANWWKGLACAAAKFYHILYLMKTRLRLIKEIGPAYFRIPAPLFWIRAGTWRQYFTDHSFKLDPNAVVNVEGFEVFWAKRTKDDPSQLPTGPFAVFIDSALCHHPDFEIEHVSVPLDEGHYFATLRTLFDRAERQFGLPIVVSLHPKANYDQANIKSLFGGRPVYVGNTPSLIRHSDLTLQHQSTATVISAMYRKPILFLTNSTLESTIVKADIDSRSSWLNQPVVNLDKFFATPDLPLPEPSVDETIYQNFVETFAIAPGAYSGMIWEAVALEYEARVPLASEA